MCNLEFYNVDLLGISGYKFDINHMLLESFNVILLIYYYIDVLNYISKFSCRLMFSYK